MPIVSNTQSEKEKENTVKITDAIVAISESEKNFRAKRKRNAKKFLLVSLAGLVTSLVIYVLVGPGPGIFAAVVSSTIPAAVNLVDD